MENEIWYAGEKCRLINVFDEEKEKNWCNDAQNFIDVSRKEGKKACCIHEGNKHGLYIQINER